MLNQSNVFACVGRTENFESHYTGLLSTKPHHQQHRSNLARIGVDCGAVHDRGAESTSAGRGAVHVAYVCTLIRTL